METKFFTFTFIVTLLMLGWVLWPFWQLLILAFLLSGIFRPVYNWIALWTRPWLASCLTCLLIIFIVFVPLIFTIGAISTEALNLYHLSRDTNLLLKLHQAIQDSDHVHQVQEMLTGLGINFEPADVPRLLGNLVKTTGLFIYEQASSWAANIMSFVLQFCILILVVFFLLIEIDQLVDFLTRLSPLPDDQDRLLMNKFTEIAGVILIGNGISGVFQGIVGGSFFAIMGLKSPVLWGAVMGILAFLPILGVGLILLPAAAILAINGAFLKAGITVLFYLILSFSVEYLVKPKFVGSQVKMHTLLVFLAIIGGMSLFGVLGIIYGPLIVTAFLALSDMYLAQYRFTLERLGRRRTALPVQSSPGPVSSSTKEEETGGAVDS
ncbi:MAG: AI-2E family transporter [Desulfobulbus propionicus]|nr:MAG: AI-2E family transporter [Desulfobulbus propionicus]